LDFSRRWIFSVWKISGVFFLESRRAEKQRRIGERNQKKLDSTADRFGIKLATSEHWLKFTLSLFFQSEALTSLFYKSLAPFPATAVKNLATALVVDESGNYAREDSTIFMWTYHMCVSFFIFHPLENHAPDSGNMWGHPCHMLPVCAVIDPIMAPVGDLQRLSITLDGEAARIQARYKELEHASQAEPVTQALAAHDVVKKRVLECRADVRKHARTPRYETAAQQEKRIVALSVATARLEEEKRHQAQSKAAVDLARKTHKLDDDVRQLIQALKKQAKEKRAAASEKWASARRLIEHLKKLDKPADQAPEGPQGLLPRNVKTPTGHHMWSRLASADFQRHCRQALKICLGNAHLEYASCEFVKREESPHREPGQNYHAWRQTWHDMVKVPLIFMQALISRDILEGSNKVQAAAAGISHFSLNAWKSLVVSTCIRESYQQVYDTDIRMVFYPTGSARSGRSFQWMFMQGHQTTTSSNARLKPKFSVPAPKSLTEAQDGQDGSGNTNTWFRRNFKYLARAARQFKVGSPPLQASHAKLPRFTRIWQMMNHAHQAKKARGPGRIACFKFTAPDMEARQVIEITREQEDGSVVKSNAVLPSFSLTAVERNGRVCAVVEGSYQSVGKARPRRKMLVLIDEAGHAYESKWLEYLNHGTENSPKRWVHGRGEFLKILELIEAGPKVALGMLGKIAGRCGCCRLKLKASQQDGVGPTCAKHFNLAAFPSSIVDYTVGKQPTIRLAPIEIIPAVIETLDNVDDEEDVFSEMDSLDDEDLEEYDQDVENEDSI